MALFIAEDCKDAWDDLCVSFLNWGEIEDFCDEHEIRSLQDRVLAGTVDNKTK